MAGVTHRLVAEEACVSLAATTYYYKTKRDIVTDASHRLLASYAAAFVRFLAGRSPEKPITLREFALRLVRNAVGKHRHETLAWCEIILDAATNADMRILARTWFAQLDDIWFGIAVTFDVPNPETTVRSAVDIVVGLLFAVIPLGTSAEDVVAVLGRGATPRLWEPKAVRLQATPPLRDSKKAAGTRAHILSAATALLLEDGPAALNYRTIAAHTGLTMAAPVYHFPTIDSLLNAAQADLFGQAKDRYRQVMGKIDYGKLDVEHLVDLTAAVFLREATEFGALNVATYLIALAAAREPRLRPLVWSSIDDQNLAWHRLLCTLGPECTMFDAMLVQRLFIGKLIRVLAMGANMTDLALVRAEFATDLRAMVSGTHWANPK